MVLTTRIPADFVCRKVLDMSLPASHEISLDGSRAMNLDSLRLHGSEGRRTLNPRADIPRPVRKLRKRTGLTQEKLAVKLDVTFPTINPINRWENGRAKPSPLAMQRIEELLRSMGDKGTDLLKLYFDSGTEE